MKKKLALFLAGVALLCSGAPGMPAVTAEEAGKTGVQIFTYPRSDDSFEIVTRVTEPASGEEAFLYLVDGDYAAITGYNGNQARISIPAEIDGHQVTTVWDMAFPATVPISIVIPDTITDISPDAFAALDEIPALIVTPGSYAEAYVLENKFSAYYQSPFAGADYATLGSDVQVAKAILNYTKNRKLVAWHICSKSDPSLEEWYFTLDDESLTQKKFVDMWLSTDGINQCFVGCYSLTPGWNTESLNDTGERNAWKKFWAANLPEQATTSETGIQTIPFVSISDYYANLFVEEYLEKPGILLSELDTEPLKDITELTITMGSSFMPLDFLPYLENLESLTIICQYSANLFLEPLESLTNLTSLTLHTPRVEDLSPIGKLQGLTYLDLSGCITIRNISFLRNLTDLTHLNLEGNQIKDISALSKLTKLEYLNLNATFRDYDSSTLEFGQKVQDITAIKNMTDLKELYLFGNLTKDLSPLKKLINLEVLDLGNNNVSNLSALSGLENLRFLNLSNRVAEEFQNNYFPKTKNRNKVVDLSPLAGLTSLEELQVVYCETLEDFTVLSSLSDLLLVTEE